MIVLFLLAAAAAAAAVVRHRRGRRDLYRLAAHLPTPRDELPIIGMAYALAGNTTDIMESLMKLCYEAMEHNGMVKLWLGHILYVVLVDAADAELVLKTCLEKDDLHRFMRKVIGNGSIFAPVPIWRRRRKVLVPAFSPKIVETFVEVFSAQGAALAAQLGARAGRGRFSVWPLVSAYTMDSVFETVMGVKRNALANPESGFLKPLGRILKLITERIFHLWLQPDWLFRCVAHKYREHQECIHMLHRFADRIIKKKRVELKSVTDGGAGADGGRGIDLKSYKTKSFLELLVSLSGGAAGFTDLELREETLTMTIAGTDTSAVAISYTLKLLGKYPEIQDSAYRELTEVFGDSDRLLAKEDLVKLKYLERVVKESLRLFPPVPVIIRKVLEDIKLPSGHVLPAGCGVAVCIWGANRDPKYWGPDAEHFDPDRFLPERSDLAHACSYMPFSNGPRSCPAYQYAHMSIKTAVSAVLRRYKIVGDAEGGPVPRIRVKLELMMKAVDDYEITLERREHNPPARPDQAPP